MILKLLYQYEKNIAKLIQLGQHYLDAKTTEVHNKKRKL